jgi:hypothetical protein
LTILKGRRASAPIGGVAGASKGKARYVYQLVLENFLFGYPLFNTGITYKVPKEHLLPLPRLRSPKATIGVNTILFIVEKLS